MPEPKFSVALCTYNGAPFLQAQLDSIARQTRLPDEVVVRDDRSCDDTRQIVERWSDTVPFRVRAEVNAENLGSTRNFARTLEACTGDLLVLCDQDDVWLPHKLSTLADFFGNHPASEAVFTDGWLVDQTLNRLRLLSEQVGFLGPRVHRDLANGQFVDTLAQRPLVTGATLALRRSLRAAVLPLPATLPRDLLHDAWIALVAALRGTLGFLDEPLILYRRHAGQQVGVSPVRSPGQPIWHRGDARAGYLTGSAADAELLARVLHARFPEHAAKLFSFDERHRHHVARRDLPAARRRRVWPVLRELLTGRYRRFGRGLRTAAGDLLN